MGFNKLFIPKKDYLEKQLVELGEEQFGQHWLRRMQKSDAIIGPTESYDFIKPFTDIAYNKSKLIFVNDENTTDIKK